MATWPQEAGTSCLMTHTPSLPRTAQPGLGVPKKVTQQLFLFNFRNKWGTSGVIEIAKAFQLEFQVN